MMKNVVLILFLVSLAATVYTFIEFPTFAQDIDKLKLGGAGFLTGALLVLLLQNFNGRK